MEVQIFGTVKCPDKLLAEGPMHLRTPLVRSGDRLTVGLAETAWKSWDL